MKRFFITILAVSISVSSVMGCSSESNDAPDETGILTIQETTTPNTDTSLQHYNQWTEAQSASEEGDMYDYITYSLDDVEELYDKGLVGTKKFKSAVQLMSYEDISNKPMGDIVAIYEKKYPNIKRYFTDTSEGAMNFLDDIKKLNVDWVNTNDDGSFTFDFDDEEAAKGLDVDISIVKIILHKFIDYGFDINFD